MSIPIYDLPPVRDDTWRRLLDLTEAFRVLAPWKWMLDCLVTVHPRADGEFDYACVMGAAGEVEGLALYRGVEGLRSLRAAQRGAAGGGAGSGPGGIQALTLWYEAKSDLDPRERQLYKRLSYAPPRGTKLAWPSLLSHRPGCDPWQLDQAEAESLIQALDRVLAFAPLLRRENGWASYPDDRWPILPASWPITSLEDLTWGFFPEPPPPEPAPEVKLLEGLAEVLHQWPIRAKVWWELATGPIGATVLVEGRPHHARMALLGDSKGKILDHVVLQPGEDEAEAVVELLCGTMITLRKRPGTIRFREADTELVRRLGPLARAGQLNFQPSPEPLHMELALTMMALLTPP